MAVADLRNLVNVGSSHIEAVIRLASVCHRRPHSYTGRQPERAGNLGRASYDFLVFRKAADKQPASAFDRLLPVPGQVRLESSI